MQTLVIGVNSPLTYADGQQLRERIRALLPPGTEILLIGNCTGLAVVEEEQP